MASRGTCTGSLFGPQGPDKEAKQITKRRKKKDPKKGTHEGDPKASDAGTLVRTKRSHADESTLRDIKKGHWLTSTSWPS